MNNINKKIDDHVKKERRKTIVSITVGLIIGLPFFGWYFLPPMGATSQTSGIVTRLIGLPTDEGDKIYLLVKLDNGEEVRSYIGDTSLYNQGRKVKLQKQEPLIIGRTIYRFQGYIDDESKP